MTGWGRRAVGALVFGLTAVLALGVPLPNHAAATDTIRVAAVFRTPIDEPWVARIHAALMRAKQELGIEYTWVDNVDATKLEQILRHYAEDGVDLVMGDSFGVEQLTRAVAFDYPDTAFVFGSGEGPVQPNFGVFDNWIHEPAYLAGMVAGQMTKTNKIGVVGAKPIPEVNRLANAFCAGAKAVNELIACDCVFIGSFYDPARAKAMASTMIGTGVDVVYAERLGAIDAANEQSVMAIGNLADQNVLAPETVVTSVVWDVWPTVKAAVNLVKSDVFLAKDFGPLSYMEKGGSYLAPYYDWQARLPSALEAAVKAKQADILSGDFVVEIDESVPQSE